MRLLRPCPPLPPSDPHFRSLQTSVIFVKGIAPPAEGPTSMSICATDAPAASPGRVGSRPPDNAGRWWRGLVAAAASTRVSAAATLAFASSLGSGTAATRCGPLRYCGAKCRRGGAMKMPGPYRGPSIINGEQQGDSGAMAMPGPYRAPSPSCPPASIQITYVTLVAVAMHTDRYFNLLTYLQCEGSQAGAHHPESQQVADTRPDPEWVGLEGEGHQG